MTRPETDPLTGAAHDDRHDDVSPPDASHKEQIYYEGSPLVRGHISSMLILGLLGILLVAAPFIHRYWQGYWLPWWVIALLIVAGLLVLVGPFVWARSIRYRISNFRIDYERGIFGKEIDTMELWHVDDIKFQQSFVERMLGVGTITVFSDDQTTPSLPIRALPNPRKIFDALKSRIIAIKRSRGVIKMDTGG